MPFPRAPLRWDKERLTEQLFSLARIVNKIQDGGVNNVLSLTLAPSVTTTVLTDARICPDTVPTLTPKTASAATAQAVLSFVSGAGKITFTHDSSAATDRNFGVVIFG